MRRIALIGSLAALAAAQPAGAAGAPATARTLARAMAAVGSNSGAYVVDETNGRVLFSLRASRQRIPASNEKLLTTSTALLRFGAGGKLATTVLGDGTLGPDAVYRGNLYLKGSGDPTFGSESFDARSYGTGATIEALTGDLVGSLGLGEVSGRVFGDDSYFDSLRSADPRYRVSPDVGPLGALVFDHGLNRETGGGFQAAPAAFAAAQLRAQLASSDVKVDGTSGARTAPSSARELARVESPPMSTLIQLTNRPSDNFFAEMLLKGLGARFGGAGSTRAGARVVTSTLLRFGVHPRVLDGSGLLRSDRISPRDVVRLLTGMHAGPLGSALESSLSVAGRNGTLVHRMRGTAAAGRCHAKTGTLTDVPSSSTLSGWCHARGGHVVAFSFLMNRTAIGGAHAAQDRMAAALASLG